MAKYANPILLILDEWLLIKPTEEEQKDIFELLHCRRKRSSTIFCSQYQRDGWYEQLGGEQFAVTILLQKITRLMLGLIVHAILFFFQVSINKL